MLHVYFIPIAICFVYTLWHFYAFSGTNLLTRCHSVSSGFLLFLCFRKVTQEIFSELDETKAEVNITSSRTKRTRGEPEGCLGRPHHRVARALLAAPPGGVGSQGHPKLRPSTYIFSSSGKPSTPDPPSMKISIAAAIIDPRSGGFWSSSWHPAREGIHHQRHLHHHARLQSDA
jgi:hypothetical protein